MKLRAVVLVLAAGSLMAQRPMGPFGAAPQMKFDELKAYLGLQDSQITQIQQAQKQAADSVRNLETQLQDKHKSLNDLLAKGTTDAAAVGKLVLEADALKKQIVKARDAARQAAVGLLFADQKTKLKGLEDAAKLQPAIRQAIALWLLTGPENAQPGFGVPGGRGVRGMRAMDPARPPVSW